MYTAGYNHFDVAEFLLENGADVNAQDKGGLIPLHNASSYGVRNVISCLFSPFSSVGRAPDCRAESRGLKSRPDQHSGSLNN